jgi:hypothetical protein
MSRRLSKSKVVGDEEDEEKETLNINNGKLVLLIDEVGLCNLLAFGLSRSLDAKQRKD